MKHVLVLLIFLGTVVTANATMVIAVNIGDGIWADYPDSKLVIKPSDKILIGVLEVPGTGSVGPGTLALGIANGLGSLDATNMLTKDGCHCGVNRRCIGGGVIRHPKPICFGWT